jgi:hypothetical protein
MQKQIGPFKPDVVHKRRGITKMNANIQNKDRAGI